MTATELATVLTVEDDPLVRADLRLVLEDAGYEVCGAARDGAEAVDLAREHRPDLILMDLGLPVMDGVEATRRIRRERNVPIVALTGHGRNELVDRAIEAGAVAHVLKPFHPPCLVETVAHSLRSHRAAFGDTARRGNRETALEEPSDYERREAADRGSAAQAREREPLRGLPLWFRV